MDRHFVKHFLTFGCFMVFRWPWRAESIPFIKLCNFVTFRNLGHVERNAMRASSIFQPGLSVFGHPCAQVMKTSVSDFSRMRSKGSRFTLGVWGLRLCSLDVAFTIATVRAIPVWPCLWEVLQEGSFLEVSDVSLPRFVRQAWHFVTFRRVLERVESRFAWQAQYFCDVFRRCVAVFVAGAALWTCPSSFFVAGAAL